VIVDDLNIVRITSVPDEADTVLIVDANTVLAASIAGEQFQPVSGERSQVAKLARGMELLKLSLCDACNFLQAVAELAREECLGFSVFERPNHSPIMV
jgi:hypothetical protein